MSCYEYSIMSNIPSNELAYYEMNVNGLANGTKTLMNSFQFEIPHSDRSSTYDFHKRKIS